MFEITCKASVFKRFIEAIDDLVQDCNIKLSENGLSITALDVSSVALISIFFTTKFFEIWEISNDTENIGVNIKTLVKLLKISKSDDDLTLCYEDNSDTLTVSFKNDDRKCEFDMKLIDVDEEDLEILDLDWPIEIKMNSTFYANHIKDLVSLGGDEISFKVNASSVCMHSKSDSVNGNIFLQSENKDDVFKNMRLICNIEEEESFDFSAKYLSSFNKLANLVENVKLYIKKDNPLLLEFKYEKTAKISYYLAPKIHDD